jgi:hypothetical protein
MLNGRIGRFGVGGGFLSANAGQTSPNVSSSEAPLFVIVLPSPDRGSAIQPPNLSPDPTFDL